LRAIFLNSWFGKAGKPFFDFVKSESSKTDIFCFMEVSPDLYNDISAILKNFRGLYDEGMFLKEIDAECGQAVFINRRVELISNGRVSIYRQLKNDIGFMQYLELQGGRQKLWLGSVHGKTRPGDKFDTQTRLNQSNIIIKFFADKNGPKIIGGDFNLMPDTKSVAMFEEAGYKNLIKKFGIKNTRNKISWKQFNNIQHFADYVFVSPDVKVNKFEVPYMEISDHLPQILDFEI
jgi:hypothetical protein